MAGQLSKGKHVSDPIYFKRFPESWVWPTLTNSFPQQFDTICLKNAQFVLKKKKRKVWAFDWVLNLNISKGVVFSFAHQLVFKQGQFLHSDISPSSLWGRELFIPSSRTLRCPPGRHVSEAAVPRSLVTRVHRLGSRTTTVCPFTSSTPGLFVLLHLPRSAPPQTLRVI